eukprot:13088207-Alexandrium_andersonii.AAC.1
MLRAAMAGAIWTPHEACKSSHSETMQCAFCGHLRADAWHVIWKCPSFEHLRQAYKAKLAPLTEEDLPSSLSLHG